MSDFKGNDIIDVRDLVLRAEDLQEELNDYEDSENQHEASNPENINWKELRKEAEEELAELEELLDEIKGYGNNCIRGVSYPDQLVRSDYWPKFVKLWAADNNVLDEDKSWPYNCIDWDEAAEELEYSTASFGDEEYRYLD